MNDYLNMDCINCGRHRVEETYICEKCGYDNKNMKYAAGGETTQEVSTIDKLLLQKDIDFWRMKFEKARDEIARLTARIAELEESDKYDTELTKKRIEEEATMWLGCVEKLQAKIKELEDANLRETHLIIENSKLAVALDEANEDASRLASQLEREQNPGYTCFELRQHYKRTGS